MTSIRYKKASSNFIIQHKRREQESSQGHKDIEVERIEGGGGGCEDSVVGGVEIKLLGKVGQVAEERAGADENELAVRRSCACIEYQVTTMHLFPNYRVEVL